jgi:uncharacterized protein (TIGR04255 family)
MKTMEIVYPNSPLTEVVAEIRFPGEMAVECRRDQFWALIRDQYPKIFVPIAGPGQSLSALVPYRFEAEDGQRLVSLAINRLTLSFRTYTGYREFSSELGRVLCLFDEVFHIEKLNRVGFRYINVIPYSREDGVIPLERILNLGLKLPPSIPERFTHVSVMFVSKAQDGQIITKLESTTKREKGEEALLLDFDYGQQEGDLRFAQALELIGKAHDANRGLFEECITDEYRSYLRGESL